MFCGQSCRFWLEETQRGHLDLAQAEPVTWLTSPHCLIDTVALTVMPSEKNRNNNNNNDKQLNTNPLTLYAILKHCHKHLTSFSAKIQAISSESGKPSHSHFIVHFSKNLLHTTITSFSPDLVLYFKLLESAGDGAQRALCSGRGAVCSTWQLWGSCADINVRLYLRTQIQYK